MEIKKLLQKQGEFYKNLTSNETIEKCNETIEKPKSVQYSIKDLKQNIIKAIKYLKENDAGDRYDKQKAYVKHYYERLYSLTNHFKENISKDDDEWLVYVLKDKDYGAGTPTIRALSQIGSEKAIDCLIETLEDRDREWGGGLRGGIVKELIDALGYVKSEKAIEPLAKYLNDDDGCVGMDVACALGKIGSEKAIEYLIESSKKNKSTPVRKFSVKSLGQIGLEKTISQIGLERIINHLIEIFRENTKYCWNPLPNAAVRALVKIGSPSIPYLTEALKDENQNVKERSVQALCDIGTEEVIGPLIEILKDCHGSPRYWIIDAFVKLNTEKAIEPLIESLKNGSSGERYNAIWAVAKIKSDIVVSSVANLLGEGCCTPSKSFIAKNADLLKKYWK